MKSYTSCCQLCWGYFLFSFLGFPSSLAQICQHCHCHWNPQLGGETMPCFSTTALFWSTFYPDFQVWCCCDCCTTFYQKTAKRKSHTYSCKWPTWVSNGPSANGVEDSSHTARLRTNFSLELDWKKQFSVLFFYIYLISFFPWWIFRKLLAEWKVSSLALLLAVSIKQGMGPTHQFLIHLKDTSLAYNSRHVQTGYVDRWSETISLSPLLSSAPYSNFSLRTLCKYTST